MTAIPVTWITLLLLVNTFTLSSSVKYHEPSASDAQITSKQHRNREYRIQKYDSNERKSLNHHRIHGQKSENTDVHEADSKNLDGVKIGRNEGRILKDENISRRERGKQFNRRRNCFRRSYREDRNERERFPNNSNRSFRRNRRKNKENDRDSDNSRRFSTLSRRRNKSMKPTDDRKSNDFKDKEEDSTFVKEKVLKENGNMQHQRRSYGRFHEHRRNEHYDRSDRNSNIESMGKKYGRNNGGLRNRRHRNYGYQDRRRKTVNDIHGITNEENHGSEVKENEPSSRFMIHRRSYDADYEDDDDDDGNDMNDRHERRYSRTYRRKRYNAYRRNYGRHSYDGEKSYDNRRKRSSAYRRNYERFYDRERSYDSRRKRSSEYERKYVRSYDEEKRRNDEREYESEGLKSRNYGKRSRYDHSDHEERSSNVDNFNERKSKKLPKYLSKRLGLWETELPRELNEVMWTVKSNDPLQMMKIRNISRHAYRGNFSATVTQLGAEYIRTHYESIRCTQRGDVQTCSNSSVLCNREDGVKDCVSNTSIITKSTRHADIAREQSLNLIHVAPLDEGILKRIFTNGLEYLESANVPTYLLKDLKEWESDLPTELKNIRWEVDSPEAYAAHPGMVHLKKNKLVESNHYKAIFFASITKNKGEIMKTLYDEKSCLKQRKMESCTNMKSSCDWLDKHKTCRTNSQKHIRVPYDTPKEKFMEDSDSRTDSLNDDF